MGPDPLDSWTAEQLATAHDGAPFDVLGPHEIAPGSWVVRALRPKVTGVELLLPDARRLAMRRIHPVGLYSATVRAPTRPAYRLAVRSRRGEQIVDDPYRLGPVLTANELQALGAGSDLRLYDTLGAHPGQHEGAVGVLFAIWAPHARRVSVIGEFNDWEKRTHPMRLRTGGFWELFIPGAETGHLYKYNILSWEHDYESDHADPVAFQAEDLPGTASRVVSLGGYGWNDHDWLAARARRQAAEAPMSIYEVHAGSWRAPEGNPKGRMSYRELAHTLAPYARDMGYTHIELMPLAEHPFMGSWGYQVTSYYAPTARYGDPEDLMYFVDYCHQLGVGVLLDWVPAHFPRDGHALAWLDGAALYEDADPLRGQHPDWGTLVFDFGSPQVRNFLLANALYWLDRFHFDGLRVDAVASMIYLDYSRGPGQWRPNRIGGREHLEAISFLQAMTTAVAECFPGALTIAEESTAWPGVTAPAASGGLGFSLKWNMGWMHDTLSYMRREPVHRQFHQRDLTFSFVYAFTERYVLPFSHDEVVHVKGSMLNKMPGDRWQKFANLRALYGWMAAHPGKKLLFMGGEIGQWAEWDHDGTLEWHLLDQRMKDGALHSQLQRMVRDLNHLISAEPALHERDFTPDGYEWIGMDESASIVAFGRYAADHGAGPLICVANLTPVPRYRYRIGVPRPGVYAEVMNTDSAIYGGSNLGNLGRVTTSDIPAHETRQSLALTLPPLAVLLLRWQSE
ncbi:MAG TPA: 1,4-alpha-glucan branching protein GlgB [Ktedonobacterales bacterium]